MTSYLSLSIPASSLGFGPFSNARDSTTLTRANVIPTISSPPAPSIMFYLLRRYRYPPPLRLAFRRHNSRQAFPLTGFYLEMLNNPLTPANPTPPGLRSGSSPAPSVAESKSTLTEAEKKASIVFGTRLASPGDSPEDHQKKKAAKGKMVAGVWVPPRPEEPDNCCMSGCVSCVMTTFLEDLEEWREAKNMAEAALRGKPLDVIREETKYDNVYDGFEGIPVGMRVFMEMERKMKKAQK